MYMKSSILKQTYLKVNNMSCASCGKNMTNPDGSNSVIGMSINLSNYEAPTNEGVWMSDNEETRAFLQKQLGPYKLNKTYNVCFECLLSSLNVKP